MTPADRGWAISSRQVAKKRRDELPDMTVNEDEMMAKNEVMST